MARVPPPLAVYADVIGVDPAPGIALLEEAGFAVRRLNGGESTARAVALLVDGTAPVGADLLDALPQLRIVATMSAGVELVDLDAARARGLWVANVPAASTEEVAVHAFAMGLSPAARAAVPRPRGARRSLARRRRAGAAPEPTPRSACSGSGGSGDGSARSARPSSGG